jgi:hypothetical protein
MRAARLQVRQVASQSVPKHQLQLRLSVEQKLALGPTKSLRPILTEAIEKTFVQVSFAKTPIWRDFNSFHKISPIKAV